MVVLDPATVGVLFSKQRGGVGRRPGRWPRRTTSWAETRATLDAEEGAGDCHQSGERHIAPATTIYAW